MRGFMLAIPLLRALGRTLPISLLMRRMGRICTRSTTVADLSLGGLITYFHRSDPAAATTWVSMVCKIARSPSRVALQSERTWSLSPLPFEMASMKV